MIQSDHDAWLKDKEKKRPKRKVRHHARKKVVEESVRKPDERADEADRNWVLW